MRIMDIFPFRHTTAHILFPRNTLKRKGEKTKPPLQQTNMALPDLQLHCLSKGIRLGYLAAPPVLNPALPTLLLLHPFMTDGYFFEPQFTDPILGGEAGEKWNIIAIDIHGHGATHGRPEFTYWDGANDIALLLVRLPIYHSVGGFFFLFLSFSFPQQDHICNASPYLGRL